MDTLTIYINEITKYKKLSLEEENVRGRKIQEILLLIAEEQNSDVVRKLNLLLAKTREDLIKGNLRLVLPIARKYTGLGVDFLDLIQEGNLGLQTAANKFDPNRGVLFSTVAHMWILQRIRRAVKFYGRTIRVPENVEQARYTILNAVARLKHGSTIEQIALACELSPNKIKDVLSVTQKIASLQTPNSSGVGCLEDLICSDDEIDRDLNQEALNLSIGLMLAKLTEKEAQIISLKYGINKPQSYSTSEIHRMIGDPLYKIKHIEKIALKKLRFLSLKNNLIDYIR